MVHLRFLSLVGFLTVVGCGETTNPDVVDSGADGASADATSDASKDVARVEASPAADAVADSAAACTCVEISATSDYRQGKQLATTGGLPYYVARLEVGKKLVPGRYTVLAPPKTVDIPYIHTVAFRDAEGRVLATHDYHIGETVAFDMPYRFVFGDYATFELTCRDGCSQSLWNIPDVFHGKLDLVVECCP